MSDLLDLDLDVDGPNPWKIESSRVIYDNGRLRLREDAVIQPDGAPGMYTFLEAAWPVVAVVPLSADNEVYLVRQWRYPWQRNSWEIPAGHGEPNESPLDSAKRELAEEVGLRAGSWESLGSGFSSASFDARYHLFLARDLSANDRRAERDGAEQDMIARRVPLSQAVQAAMDGRIEHSMSVVGLLRVARRLGL
ncbi:MAG TPA: NUDIX hydrolase [Chloroflexota bacterium]|nr:NUDIX hydrolase [Chloroflexota bacterium]